METTYIATSKEDLYLEKANEQAKFDHESAKVINKELPFTVIKDFLVKPLPIKTVKVIKDVPVENGKIDKSTGAKEYDIKKQEETIEIPFQEGIIIAMPDKDRFESATGGFDYVLGEHILYAPKSAMQSYLFQDTVLLQAHNIMGRIKPGKVEASKELTKEVKQMKSKAENIRIKK